VKSKAFVPETFDPPFILEIGEHFSGRKGMLHVFYKPARWNASQPPVILQKFSVLRVRRGACRESEHGQLPGYPQCFPNGFMSISCGYVLQHVRSYNCLEGTVRKGELSGGANDWTHGPPWGKGKIQVATYNMMRVEISKAERPGSYFKNCLADNDMTPQDSKYGKVSRCPTEQLKKPPCALTRPPDSP
jgi:hypothetical protein